MNENLPETTVIERASYEPPSIVEDLPLESYSLACDKSGEACGAGTDIS